MLKRATLRSHLSTFSTSRQNVTANHRASDGVFTEDGAQTLTARFMYGPLDMVTLTGEKVSARGERFPSERPT